MNYRELLLNLTSTYKERLEWLNHNVFLKIYLVVPFSILIIIYSSIRYHNRYVRFDDYQNNILGVKFYELEAKRTSSGQLALLPLKSTTIRNKYVGLFELRMTAKEKRYTIKSLSRLLVALVPLMLALWADTKLASLSHYLAESTRFTTEWEPGEAIGIEVKGQGFMANNFRFNYINFF